MGIKFFENVFEIQKVLEPDYHFINKIQMNGTLLNNDFLDLFREHHVRIGVSLDGPQPIHDTHRPYPDGKGSFDDVMAGIQLLNESCSNGHGQSNIQSIWGKGALAIFTTNTIAHKDHFYHFFEQQNLNLKINPLFFEGRGRDVQHDLGLTPKEMRNVMVDLFDEWFYQDPPTIFIEPFGEIVRNLITGQPQACIFSGKCQDKFLHVAPDGDIYLCGLWPSEKFCLGNINTRDVPEILASPILQHVEQERNLTKEHCSQCEFYAICNSGCLRRSFAKRGNFADHDEHCPYYKRLFTHLHQAMAQELGT